MTTTSVLLLLSSCSNCFSNVSFLSVDMSCRELLDARNVPNALPFSCAATLDAQSIRATCGGKLLFIQCGHCRILSRRCLHRYRSGPTESQNSFIRVSCRQCNTHHEPQKKQHSSK